ncbi:hypothetical protein Hanom_Chr06g00519411 [Helianthus anomalus]
MRKVFTKIKFQDDPNMMMYKMFGSEKLYSDDEFLIQNVNMKKLKKVCKLVEIENLANTARYLNFKKDKSYYSKPRNSYFQKKNYSNERDGLGYSKKKHKKKFQKLNFVKKMNFVHGTSSESDKESQFSR